MKNLQLIFLLSIFLASCAQNTDEKTINTDNSKQEIAAMLDSFNLAAANADYDSYFNFYTNDAVYIGTDPTEHWDKKAFMVWAKPFFDRKRAWTFKAINRNIYFGEYNDIAWFDELLETQMKICRGSGVVVRQNNQWKIQQYVLSMTIPNAKTDSVVKIKTEIEDSLIQQFIPLLILK